MGILEVYPMGVVARVRSISGSNMIVYGQGERFMAFACGTIY